MANDDKTKLEIEVAIKDGFSVALKELGKQLEGANKRALEIGVGPTGAFQKFRRENDQLAESAKRSNAQLAVTSGIMTVMSKTLLGSAGLAAGFYAVSKSLEDVAVSSVRMRNFATDTGLAVGKIHDLQQSLRRGGFSKGEGDNIIGALGSMANNLAAFKEASKIYQDLIKSPEGGAAIATRLNELAKSGDQIGVINEFLRTFNQQSRARKIAMAEMVGVTVSGLQRMADAAKNASNIKVWEVNKDEAQKYLDWWVDAEVRFQNIFTDISGHGIKVVNEITGALKAQGITTRSIADFIKTDIDKTVATIKATIEEIKAIKAWLNSSSISDSVNKALGIDPNKYPVGEDPMGADYTRKPSWKARGLPTDFGGMRRSGSEDGINILTDIRDTLQRMEGTGGGMGGSHASGGGEGGGSGRQALGRRLGIDTGSGGGAGSTIKNSLTPSGTTRGDRNNNPGNLKFGEHAKAFGAVAADDKGFAIFPNMESGAAAHETLLKSDSYKGLTLDQFGNKYAEGNADWKRTVGKGLGIGPNDIVDNQDPRLPGLIKKAEGTGGPAGDGRRVNYFQHQGKGPFDRSEMETVKTPFGPIAVHPEAAADFRGFYRELDEEGAPINKLGSYNKRLKRWGSGWSSHATGAATDIDDQVQLSPKMQSWIASNPERWEDLKRKYGMRQPLPVKDPAHIEWTGPRADADRERIDKTASGGGTKWGPGQMNAKVEFLGVPPGVRTSAEVNDVFTNLQISKTKQGGVYHQPDQGYD